MLLRFNDNYHCDGDNEKIGLALMNKLLLGSLVYDFSTELITVELEINQLLFLPV